MQHKSRRLIKNCLDFWQTARNISIRNVAGVFKISMKIFSIKNNLILFPESFKNLLSFYRNHLYQIICNFKAPFWEKLLILDISKG